MSKSTAILGKAGVGKTFLAAHLGMAFGYLGDKTLVVGCDQKRDTMRALSSEVRPSLMEILEANDFAYDRLHLPEITVSVNDYVDVVELGPSQLLVGHYGTVLDEAFHVFESLGVFGLYDRVLYDVSDERFDAPYVSLFRKVEAAVAVTDESAESLFVLNRLLRASLIGSYEYGYPLHIVGVINNRSVHNLSFERYIERSRCFPLLTIADTPELAHLRRFHRTLFTLESRSPALERIMDGILKVAELLRGEPINLNPVSPLEDEEIWALAPPVSLPS